MSIKPLFDYMRLKSYKLQKNDPDADGLAFWRKIKNELAKQDEHTVEWILLDDEETDRIMNLTEYEINGHGDKNIVEINHFQIQYVRIPRTETASIRKIMQVALNIGQYEGKVKNRQALEHLQLENFVSEESIKTLEEKLPKSFYTTITGLIDK